MEYGQNFDLVRLNSVDDAIFAFDDFTNSIVCKFRNDSARVWEGADLFRSAG